MKTILKYIVVGIIVCFSSSGLRANASTMYQQDILVPFSGEIISDKIVPNKYCFYVPYSQQEISTLTKETKVYLTSYLITLSMPKSVKEGYFVERKFFYSGEKDMLVCVYYRT